MVKGEVMGEVKSNKKPRNRRRPRRPQYQRHPFATSITLYSADGSPVPESVLSQVETYIGGVAAQHNLLTAVNRASS
jgi:hypothetical protein